MISLLFAHKECPGNLLIQYERFIKNRHQSNDPTTQHHLFAVGDHKILQRVAVSSDQFQHCITTNVPHHQRSQPAGGGNYVAEPADGWN